MFTVTDSLVTLDDIVFINKVYRGTPISYDWAVVVNTGSFMVRILNVGQSPLLPESLVFNFALLKLS